jgi:PAS domain-containing protein
VRVALDGTIAELDPAACRFLAQPPEDLLRAGGVDLVVLDVTMPEAVHRGCSMADRRDPPPGRPD